MVYPPQPAKAAWPTMANCLPVFPLSPAETTVQVPLEDDTVEFEPLAQRIKTVLR
jgi:hypothetical protein